jgi:hypothetical protein
LGEVLGGVDLDSGCAGVNGTAGAADDGAGTLAPAGVPNLPSRTDLGTRDRVDMSCRMNARARKIPPDHQEIVVNRLPACRIPMNDSGDELAPPKLDAKPPPVPLCIKMAATRTRLSIMSKTSKNVYI